MLKYKFAKFWNTCKCVLNDNIFDEGASIKLQRWCSFQQEQLTKMVVMALVLTHLHTDKECPVSPQLCSALTEGMEYYYS